MSGLELHIIVANVQVVDVEDVVCPRRKCRDTPVHCQQNMTFCSFLLQLLRLVLFHSGFGNFSCFNRRTLSYHHISEDFLVVKSGDFLVIQSVRRLSPVIESVDFFLSSKA